MGGPIFHNNKPVMFQETDDCGTAKHVRAIAKSGVDSSPKSKAAKQLCFASSDFTKSSNEYGGSLFKNRRKSLRPLSSKHALHLVLKCPDNNKMSLKKHKNAISILLSKYSIKFGIKIYKYAIAGNHIHIVLLTSHRYHYRAWIRTFTGQLALRFKIKWGHRPWSRILTWGKEFFTVTKYVLQNILEAERVISYLPRKSSRRKHSGGIVWCHINIFAASKASLAPLSHLRWLAVFYSIAR